MKRILISLILFFTGTAFVSASTCENAPNDALLEFQPPYNEWFKVTCDSVRKAHFITVQDGYTWKEINTNKPYSFNAYAPISPKFTALELNTYEPHKYYFKQAKSLLIKPFQLDGVNKLLTESEYNYEVIHQHDVLSSTRTVYNFFVFVKEGEPEWIVACHSNNCSQTVTIKVDKQ